MRCSCWEWSSTASRSACSKLLQGEAGRAAEEREGGHMPAEGVGDRAEGQAGVAEAGHAGLPRTVGLINTDQRNSNSTGSLCRCIRIRISIRICSIRSISLCTSRLLLRLLGCMVNRWPRVMRLRGRGGEHRRPTHSQSGSRT